MAEALRSSLLKETPHAFSTRAPLDLQEILPDGVLVRVKQVHSPEAVFATEAMAEPLEADALVTDRPGLLLGIVTADCAPVLLVDGQAGVVGAAHAGWRGAVSGVLENTVAAMARLGSDPADIRAAIGPTIAQPSYEVDEAFRANFSDADDQFFEQGREGHWQFDLPGFAAHRLVRAGVTQVDDLREDTYFQPDRFHSFRRASHRGENTTGRQLSVIGLPH